MNTTNTEKQFNSTRECVLLAILKENDLVSRTYLFMEKTRKIVSYTINTIFDNVIADEYQEILPGDVVELNWGKDKKLHCKLLYSKKELETENELMTSFLFPITNEKMIFMNAVEQLDKENVN